MPPPADKHLRLAPNSGRRKTPIDLHWRPSSFITRTRPAPITPRARPGAADPTPTRPAALIYCGAAFHSCAPMRPPARAGSWPTWTQTGRRFSRIFQKSCAAMSRCTSTARSCRCRSSVAPRKASSRVWRDTLRANFAARREYLPGDPSLLLLFGHLSLAISATPVLHAQPLPPLTNQHTNTSNH